MFACRFGYHQMIGDHLSPRLACLALFCAFMLLDPHAFTVRSAQAGHIPAHTPDWTDFNNSPLPADRCDLNGEVVAQLVPRLDDDSDDPTRSTENAWPIKWEGPSLKSVAIVDVFFDELDPNAAHRVDALLTLRFDHPLPVACLKRLDASLQIFDQTTGSIIPADRVFFNHHHFHN